MRFFVLTTALLLLTPFQVTAEDHIYQPDFCEFAITFPAAPYDSERCDPENINKCVQQKTYTEIFEGTATVNFRTHCQKTNNTAFQSYTEPTTKVILKALGKRNNIRDMNTTFREEEQYKQAGLVGTGRSGNKGMIYLAQIWVGQHSTLILESELIGDEHEAADMLFRDILRRVGYKPLEKKELAEETDDESSEEDETKETD